MNVRRLLAVLAWTLVVLVCSAGVWAVIRTAGTGVTTTPEVPTTIGNLSATNPVPSPRPRATTPRPAPRPAEVRRTWQGTAGAVVAACRGATLSFRGAQPNAGWRVEVGDRGPEQIEVHFATNQGEDDDGREVELKVRCAKGQPQFSRSGD